MHSRFLPKYDISAAGAGLAPSSLTALCSDISSCCLHVASHHHPLQRYFYCGRLLVARYRFLHHIIVEQLQNDGIKGDDVAHSDLSKEIVDPVWANEVNMA